MCELCKGGPAKEIMNLLKKLADTQYQLNEALATIERYEIYYGDWLQSPLNSNIVTSPSQKTETTNQTEND